MRSVLERAVLIAAIVVASWSPTRGQRAPAVTAFSYGGNLTDVVNAIAVDAQYNIYVVGRSNSRDLPGLEQGYQKIPRGTDAFVAKLTWDGRPQWATFLGGGDAGSNRFGVTPDDARAVAVDAQGNVYVGGSTASADFPVVNAYQRSKRATGLATDGFLAKLDPTGARLLFSTYLGGADNSSSVEHLAVAMTGDVIVGLKTAARQFEVTRDLSTPHTEASSGTGGVIVARFQPHGMPSWLVRTGFGVDSIHGINADAQMSVMLAATSSAIPCGAGVCSGAFLQRINAGGTAADLRATVPGAWSASLASFVDGSVVLAGTHSGSGLGPLNPWQATPDLADNGFATLVNSGGAVDVMTFLPGIADTVRLATNTTGRMHLLSDSRGSALGLLGAPPIEHPQGPVFLSSDRGDTWRWASRGLIGSGIVAIDHTRGYLYALIDSKLFRSIDDGRSWSLLRSFSEHLSSLATVVVDPLDPTIMYVADNMLVRLEQDGRHVVTLRESVAGAGGGFRLLGVDPIDGTLWARSGFGTVEISRDRGRTWNSRFDSRDSIRNIAFNPNRAGDVLIALGNGVLRSSDHGATWSMVTANIADLIHAEHVAIDPADARRIYVAARFPRRLLISPDAGTTWYESLQDLDVRSIAISNVPPFQVTLSATDPKTNESYLLVTGDGGVTWSRRATLPPSVLTHFRGDSYRLLAASGSSPRPFLTRIDRINARDFVRSAGMFLEQGDIGAIAAARDGESVVALTQGLLGFDTTIRIIKIDR